MITRTAKKENFLTSLYYRAFLFTLFLGFLAYHFKRFYSSVWNDNDIAIFWAISHIGLAAYLMLKNDAWDSFTSSGAITIYTIALTYILHTNILQIDSYTFKGLNIALMKLLIIAIVLLGTIGLAISFKKD